MFLKRAGGVQAPSCADHPPSEAGDAEEYTEHVNTQREDQHPTLRLVASDYLVSMIFLSLAN
jgi:hypothetical protein